MQSRTHKFIYVVAIFFLSIAGCGGDDDPVTPPAPKLGNISIGCTQNGLIIPWTLTLPGGLAASGLSDSTFTDMPAGAYSLTWEAVDGWDTPSPNPALATLAPGGTITFTGAYSEIPALVPGYLMIPPSSIPVPATFTMGSSVYDDETPHQVTLTGRCYMAAREVTNGEYVSALQWAYDQDYVTATSSSVSDALDGSSATLLDLDGSACQITFSEGLFSTIYPDRPVVYVSWFGSAAYCDWLSLQAGLPRAYDHSTWACNSGNPYTASGYRLPTEAEWEFACRAGTATLFNTGNCLDAGTEANYTGVTPYADCPSGPFLGQTSDVGSYPANPWGLLDIHGNVMEWCNDWYVSYQQDETDPVGAGAGSRRMVRGGSWYDMANYCRSAFRRFFYPDSVNSNLGFRLVRSTP